MNKKNSGVINWHEQFKVRPRRNASIKHEITKLLLVINLIEKYRKNLYWIRIYTEHPLRGGKVCDVYFENIKTNEIICFEIQKKITKKWLSETKKFYSSYDPIYFTADWLLVDENKLPEDINELNEIIKGLL